ncbi:unnamed protein product [Bursaphelenchus okinawaensis]|uniref:Phosphatidic acid phosphatase type 2/haloperoxidase domain-containing protein n=1 Tax=Bursaphelenchus okinawaensis TaxID=465554 RepID=A0A811K257_9BILA|nr:unnamed protein product [Bursaphelenchus okinawaensis]CAG9089477.1 unnamed protein product [Bursaphelenchus okinawaensis]
MTASSNLDKLEPLPWLRAVMDIVLCIGSLFLINGLFEWMGVYRRGFFCDDETIMYPMKPETIGLGGLLVISFVPQLVVITITESIRLYRFPTEELSSVERGRAKPIRLVSRVLKFYGYSLLIIVVCSFLTAVTKNAVGRLRPNFLDVCQPTFDWRHNCTTHEYLTDYECTADRSKWAMKDARLSFFSGHSSMSMSAAMFIVVYLQSRAAGECWLNTLIPILQSISFCGAIYVGLTRIFDHKHHWSDVLTGLIVGMTIVILVWKFVAGYDIAPLKQRRRKCVVNIDDVELQKPSAIQTNSTEYTNKSFQSDLTQRL